MAPPFRITIIHPCMGRRAGQSYIRTWQMESLPAAVIAALTPEDVELKFHDDRLEALPFDEPADLVAIPVETYTAKRAYQIATEYRKRKVPVVMGGFHATLCTNEVSRYADAVVVGEAELLWERVVDDFRHGRPERLYRQEGRATLERATPDRSIFAGKRYLPIGLIEVGRGCVFHCDFCAVHAMYGQAQVRRPLDAVMAELTAIRDRHRVFFFVDDNITANLKEAKAFFEALIPLKLRWISQGSLNMTADEDLLALMARSGCQGLLIGFESLNPRNLEAMDKGVNIAVDLERALEALHRHNIRIYGTFVFGYDEDTPDSFDAPLAFAQRHGFYLAAFNHLTPFPGTTLYGRLEREKRLLLDHWWLDDSYSFNRLAFTPKHMTPEELQARCVDARRRFYSVPSMLERGFYPVNRSDWFMFWNFFPLNMVHRAEVGVRNHHPLGDGAWSGSLLEVS